MCPNHCKSLAFITQRDHDVDDDDDDDDVGDDDLEDDDDDDDIDDDDDDDLGPEPLNFGGQKTSGAFDSVWPSANTLSACHVYTYTNANIPLRLKMYT